MTWLSMLGDSGMIARLLSSRDGWRRVRSRRMSISLFLWWWWFRANLLVQGNLKCCGNGIAEHFSAAFPTATSKPPVCLYSGTSPCPYCSCPSPAAATAAATAATTTPITTTTAGPTTTLCYGRTAASTATHASTGGASICSDAGYVDAADGDTVWRGACTGWQGTDATGTVGP